MKVNDSAPAFLKANDRVPAFMKVNAEQGDAVSEADVQETMAEGGAQNLQDIRTEDLLDLDEQKGQKESSADHELSVTQAAVHDSTNTPAPSISWIWIVVVIVVIVIILLLIWFLVMRNKKSDRKNS